MLRFKLKYISNNEKIVIKTFNAEDHLEATTTLYTRLVGKLTEKYPYVDQIEFKNMFYGSLEGLEVSSAETGLMVSDLEEKIMQYLQIRSIEGLAKSSIKNYKNRLLNLEI